MPASALAVSCPANISGNALSGLVCDFTSGSNVTVSNGAEIGGINQQTYNPVSSFILNNGTINNDSGGQGINIFGSSLSNGLANNGTINGVDNSGILIDNSSNVSGGISNTNIISSTNYIGFQLDNGSTLNGGITNSGKIISNSSNNPAVYIGNNSVVSGNINNSGTIHAFGVGDGFQINNSSVNGSITNSNSGTIWGGGSGLILRVLANVSGNITNSGIITGDANNGLALFSTASVGGNITNSGTITGGTSGLSVDSFNTVNGSISNSGTISGGVNGVFVNDSSIVNGGIQNHGTIIGGTDAIYVSADSTVGNIDLYTGSRVVGAIDAVNTAVNISGDFYTEGTMNVNALNISSAATFYMANNITAASAVNNAGTLAIGTTAQNITGNYVQETGGLLKLGVQNTASYGQLLASGTADLSQSGAINLDVASGAKIAAGNKLTSVVSGGTFVAPGSGFNITDNSRLLNFTAALNGSNTGVDITAVNDGSTSVSLSNSAMGNNGGIGTAQKLDEIIALNQGGDWQNVIGALNSLSTDQQIADAVKQTTPVLVGATNTALIEAISNASRIVQARQESNSGLSSGEDFQTNRNFWLKTFGSWGDQGNQNGVVGYDSKAYGVITGADKLITDKASLGVGVSYFNSEFNGNDGNDQVNVDSYLAIVYGSYRLDEKTDVNAQVEAGYNSSDSKRQIDFGGLSRVANGNYDGWDFHAGTGVGRLVNVDSDTTIIPKIRLDYYAVGNESYNESGAGVLNLHVDSQTQDALIPALEVKANHSLAPEFVLALNTGLGYDLLNDHNIVSAGFTGGGGIFTTRGLESSPWIIRSGAGVTWKQSDELDLTARYDREDRGSDYNNQTVSLKLRMPF